MLSIDDLKHELPSIHDLPSIRDLPSNLPSVHDVTEFVGRLDPRARRSPRFYQRSGFVATAVAVVVVAVVAVLFFSRCRSNGAGDLAHRQDPAGDRQDQAGPRA